MELLAISLLSALLWVTLPASGVAGLIALVYRLARHRWPSPRPYLIAIAVLTAAGTVAAAWLWGRYPGPR